MIVKRRRRSGGLLPVGISLVDCVTIMREARGASVTVRCPGSGCNEAGREDRPSST